VGLDWRKPNPILLFLKIWDWICAINPQVNNEALSQGLSLMRLLLEPSLGFGRRLMGRQRVHTQHTTGRLRVKAGLLCFHPGFLNILLDWNWGLER